MRPWKAGTHEDKRRGVHEKDTARVEKRKSGEPRRDGDAEVIFVQY